jgi:CRP-like cAMP-binding protein
MKKDLLDRFALIEGFTEDQINILGPLLEEVAFEDEQVIFHQGNQANYLYFVLNGRVSIRFKPEDGPVLCVAEVEEGDVFGWSSALGSTLYTSSAVCTRGGVFIRIDGKDLKKICQEYPETGILILNRLASVIAQRLRGTHEQVVALLHRGLNDEESGGDKR